MLIILYGSQPYVPALERRDPCPVCRGTIREGQWVYCEACSATGVPARLLTGVTTAVAPAEPKKITFLPAGERGPRQRQYDRCDGQARPEPRPSSSGSTHHHQRHP